MSGREFHTQISTCPACQYTCDRVTNTTSDEPPAPGDFTVCLRCAALLILIDHDPGLRFPTDEELNKVRVRPDLCAHVLRIQRHIRVLRAQRN